MFILETLFIFPCCYTLVLFIYTNFVPKWGSQTIANLVNIPPILLRVIMLATSHISHHITSRNGVSLNQRPHLTAPGSDVSECRLIFVRRAAQCFELNFRSIGRKKIAMVYVILRIIGGLPCHMIPVFPLGATIFLVSHHAQSILD